MKTPQLRHSSFAPSALVAFAATLAAALLLVGCSSTEPSGDNNSSQVKGSSSSKTGTSLSFLDADLAKNDQSCEFDEAANLLKCKEKNYKTVKIGDQIWMAENLNYGDFISTEDIVLGNNTAYYLQVGSVKFCYDNDQGNCDRYGGLYQWHTVMGFDVSCSTILCSDQISEGHHQGICPKGWHVPTKEESFALYEFQYSFTRGGGVYLDTSAGGTNESGYSALLSGYCNPYGNFYKLQEYEAAWTADFPVDNPKAATMCMIKPATSVSMILSEMTKKEAISLRCIKDQ